MNKFIKFFLSLLILAILFANNNYPCCISYAASNINKIKFIQENNILVIKISGFAPDLDNNQKKQAFILLKPYLNKKLQKASVIWQKDESYSGRIVSASNVYIIDYLNKKISKDLFIKSFNVQDIEPIYVFKNKIEKKLSSSNISDENYKKSKDLREKADIYRLSSCFDTAIRLYNEAIQFNPDDAISYYWIGEIYRSQKNYSLAKECYIKALSIDPEFMEADKALSEISLP